MTVLTSGVCGQKSSQSLTALRPCNRYRITNWLVLNMNLITSLPVRTCSGFQIISCSFSFVYTECKPKNKKRGRPSLVPRPCPAFHSVLRSGENPVSFLTLDDIIRKWRKFGRTNRLHFAYCSTDYMLNAWCVRQSPFC